MAAPPICTVIVGLASPARTSCTNVDVVAACPPADLAARAVLPTGAGRAVVFRSHL